MPEAQRAILAWLVEGHSDYLDQRINPPKIVTDYTDEYRHEMNPLADFFEGWAAIGGVHDFEPWQAIKEHVQRWADESRIRVPGDVQIKASLRAAGCSDERQYVNGARVRGWTKIRLVEPTGQ
jgi:phage/plasmid-associated DNA primase